jgi:antitoxin StbD
MQVFNQAKGQPVAILNRNQPVFYCISPLMFEAFLDRLEDEEFARIVASREGEEEIKVDINDL